MKTTSKKIKNENNQKKIKKWKQPTKIKMKTTSNKMTKNEDDLKKNKKWRRPKKNKKKALPDNLGGWFSVCNLILTQLERRPQKKNGRRPQKKIKNEDDLKKNKKWKQPKKNKKMKTTYKNKNEDDLKQNDKKWRRPQKK